ncbi:MAG TPA: trypsin-like peptidase domain-containing protein [Ktedonobacteraceae bacterium]
MGQSRYELLRQCMVRVAVPGGPKKAQGTGFFVAPGLILTCAHVVEDAQKQNAGIEVTWWKGQKTIEQRTIAAQLKEYRAAPYPDIALLQMELTDHPCVGLGEAAEPFDTFYSYGCPVDYPNGDSVTLECEGWTDDVHSLLKLKQGQLKSGFSGAPLLNRRTGQVCGLVKLSRDQGTDLGGRAIPTKTVLQEFSQLKGLQQNYHQAHKDWSGGNTEALKIFYSYAHEDEKLRKELENHLSLLKRQNLISGWYDRDIGAGREFGPAIKKQLNSADIILLLISPSFMGSDYCYDEEMMRAMERHEAGNARVIPVILRTVDWHKAPFGGLLAVPRDGKAVTEWTNKDLAFFDVAKNIRTLVENWGKGDD